MNKEDLDSLIAKGERGLKAAKELFQNGDYDFSASRAYYSMFHVTEAVLLTKNLASSSHRGLLALFYEHFIKPDLFDKSLHQDLNHAMDLRQQGDYWADSEITDDMAKDLLVKAENYITTLKKYLGKGDRTSVT